MTNLFLGFLNRSLSAAVLIFAVVLVRLAFKKAPKWLLCALWALAAVRLLCPFSIESVLERASENEKEKIYEIPRSVK